MKKMFALLLISTFCITGCSSDNDPKTVQQQPVHTVIYLIRHAEKADNSANPDLSAAGLIRANNWAAMFQDIAFDGLYSTNYNRTLQTIEPTAAQNNKEATLYNPATFSLVDVIANHSGKNVLIVGHSNTVPQLINAFLGFDHYPDMAETEFGNLYKITIVDGAVWHQKTVHN